MGLPFVGIVRLLGHRIHPVTFVMHSSMDAAEVAPAWAAMQRGEVCDDPRLAAPAGTDRTAG